MRFLSTASESTYAPSQLRRCIRREDIWRNSLDDDKIEEACASISDQFYTSESSVIDIRKSVVRDYALFRPGGLYDSICLRRTNEILKRALRVSLLHRDDEVRQLLSVLDNEPNCLVFRTDISRFFPSLPFLQLIQELQEAGFRNHCALKHLRELQKTLVQNFAFHGLPPGIPLSSTLADHALHNFDRTILNLDSVAYYARYVDDIFIVHFPSSEPMESKVRTALPFGLNLNSSKTQSTRIVDGNSVSFLGYTITLGKPQAVRIAEPKIDRAKRRVALSLKAYLADGDFSMLLMRLRFLTSSTRMSKAGRRAKIYAGYRHVYQLCTPSEIESQLGALDHFLRGLIRSKRSPIHRGLSARLSADQWKQINKLSFVAGYKNKITHDLHQQEISEIKEAWMYE